MLNRTPKTDLTLSAVPGLAHEVDRTPAALHRATLCTICGRTLVQINGRWAHATRPVESETELRAAWGDR
jgi:hypothetical protein